MLRIYVKQADVSITIVSIFDELIMYRIGVESFYNILYIHIVNSNSNEVLIYTFDLLNYKYN